MDGDGLLGRGCAARADRPYRLIGDQNMVHVLTLQSRQSITNLPHHDGLSEAGLTISETLADAEERTQAVAKRRLYFLIRPLVLLAEVLTTLGMTDDHELTTRAP